MHEKKQCGFFLAELQQTSDLQDAKTKIFIYISLTVI